MANLSDFISSGGGAFAGSILPELVNFDFSASFTFPQAGRYRLIAVGAGGSGGAVRINALRPLATGGGGGAVCIKDITALAGDTLTFTVGAGGAAIQGGATPKNGIAGGNTTVTGPNSLSLIAGGGAGGVAVTNPDNTAATVLGGAGGAATGGDFNHTGGRGGNISVPSTTNRIGGGTGGGGCGLFATGGRGGDADLISFGDISAFRTGGGFFADAGDLLPGALGLAFTRNAGWFRSGDVSNNSAGTLGRGIGANTVTGLNVISTQLLGSGSYSGEIAAGSAINADGFNFQGGGGSNGDGNSSALGGGGGGMGNVVNNVGASGAGGDGRLIIQTLGITL